MRCARGSCSVAEAILMPDVTCRMLTLMCTVIALLPIGTNLGLLHLLWMVVSGRPTAAHGSPGHGAARPDRQAQRVRAPRLARTPSRALARQDQAAHRQWTLSRRGPRQDPRCRRNRIRPPGADGDLPLALRRLRNQAVLRRNPPDAALRSGPPSRALRRRFLTRFTGMCGLSAGTLRHGQPTYHAADAYQ